MARMAETFRAGGIEKLFAVGREDDAGLYAEARNLGIEYVPNPWPNRGMAGSVLLAVNRSATDWIALCPCDLPRLTSEPIRACVEQLCEPAKVVQPECDGRARHPVFLSMRIEPDLSEHIQTGGTLRDFLAGREVRRVQVGPCEQYRDIDTPEEYLEALRELGFDTD